MLAKPEQAQWSAVPDTLTRTSIPDQYALVSHVRPDSTSPGVSFLCVVRRTEGGVWSVLDLQTSTD